jgi:hypothetical protein
MTSKSSPEIVSAEPVSPHNQALYEAGKIMLIESIDTAREFCKFMISLSAAGIPAYLGLIEFVLPENYQLGVLQGAVIVVSPVLFLAAMIVFSIGFMPRTSYFSLDIIEEINDERLRIMNQRYRFIKLGMGLFVAGTLISIATVILNLGRA